MKQSAQDFQGNYIINDCRHFKMYAIILESKLAFSSNLKPMNIKKIDGSVGD